MSNLSDQELAARAVAVLVNKVPGLESWFYFDVTIPRTRPTDLSLLEKLEPDGSGYRWNDARHGPGTGAGKADEAFAAVLAAITVRSRVAELAFKRIFDLNEVENDSGAFIGPLGDLNEQETKRRASMAWARLNGRSCRGKPYVVAEGDSWFQFPKIKKGALSLGNPVKDLIEHLMDRPDLCLETLAAGGDWLSNMLKSRQYVSALSKVEPDVFLFSGGGNDMLGSERVGNMVMHVRRVPPALDPVPARLLAARQAGDLAHRSHFDEVRFEAGLGVLSVDFFRFLNLVLVQYLLFLWSLRQASRFSGMAIITQGYDFVIPKSKSDASWLSAPRQRLVNNGSNSGKWLWGPMEKKGLSDDLKQNALYAMVQEYNELLVGIVTSGLFDPIFHIDSRGLAKPDDWFDEIHLK